MKVVLSLRHQAPDPLSYLARERATSVHGAGARVDDDVVLASGRTVLNHPVEGPA